MEAPPLVCPATLTPERSPIVSELPKRLVDDLAAAHKNLERALAARKANAPFVAWMEDRPGDRFLFSCEATRAALATEIDHQRQRLLELNNEARRVLSPTSIEWPTPRADILKGSLLVPRESLEPPPLAKASLRSWTHDPPLSEECRHIVAFADTEFDEARVWVHDGKCWRFDSPRGVIVGPSDLERVRFWQPAAKVPQDCIPVDTTGLDDMTHAQLLQACLDEGVAELRPHPSNPAKLHLVVFTEDPDCPTLITLLKPSTPGTLPDFEDAVADLLYYPLAAHRAKPPVDTSHHTAST